MQAQIEYGVWVEVDTKRGTEIIRGDIVNPPMMELGVCYDVGSTEDIKAYVSNLAPYIESNPEDVYCVSLLRGWGARLSSPGYIDCTEWSVFDTENKAKEFIDDFLS